MPAAPSSTPRAPSTPSRRRGTPDPFQKPRGRRQVLMPVAEKRSSLFAQIVANTPASYFGMVLGLAGLANAWRSAALVWHLPGVVADWLYLVAGIVWAVLVALYILKAILAFE